MKKKILFGAVIAAALFGFASCQKEIGDIDWKGAALGSGDGTKTFTVKQENTGKKVARGMKQIGPINRAVGTCVLRQFNQSKSTSDGMIGFATCFEQNKAATGAEPLANEGTYNFLVVGVRNHNGVTQTYASYFYNIKEEELSNQNFGVDDAHVKTAYDAKATEAYEVELEKFPKGLSGVTFDKDGTLTVAVTFEEDDKGNITITWRKDVKEFEAAGTIKENGAYTGTVLYSITADASKIGRDENSKKGKLCTYANIYAGKTLNARWDIYDVSWTKIATANADDDDFIDVGDIFFEEVK